MCLNLYHCEAEMCLSLKMLEKWREMKKYFNALSTRGCLSTRNTCHEGEEEKCVAIREGKLKLYEAIEEERLKKISALLKYSIQLYNSTVALQ